MKPEDSASIRIFFRDNLSLKGPFTEEQIQDWYWEKLFEGSYQFFFVEEGQSPDFSTEFFTLDDLCTQNGRAYPFRLPSVEVPPRETIRAPSGQKLSDLDEKTRVLRLKCNDLLTARECFGIKENSSMTISELAMGYLAIFRFFRYSETHCMWYLQRDVPPLDNYFTNLSMELKEKFFTELVRVIEEKPYLFCSFCDRYMFTARQTFMHIASTEHASNTSSASEYYSNVNHFMTKMVGIKRVKLLYEEEEEKVRIQREKWSSMSLNDKEIRSSPIPSNCNLFDFLGLEEDDEENYVIADRLVSLLQPGSGDGEVILSTLSQVIGKAKTRCLACKLIFANLAEYYTHLLTFSHLSNVQTFDIETIIVNLHKRHIARLQPWPKEAAQKHWLDQFL